MEKRILCYGDSNTWGFIPGEKCRYPASVRWTGVVQQQLGNDFTIIENGLNGRTTVFDDPFYPCRNGLTGLDYALISSAPLDLVVLSLGTNDLKFTDTFSSKRGIERLIFEIQSANDRLRIDAPIFPNGAKVLVISPIRVHPDIEKLNPETTFGGTPEKSKDFKKFIAPLEQESAGVFLLDAAEYASPSEIDGVHMGAESHNALGLAISKKIQQIF